MIFGDNHEEKEDTLRKLKADSRELGKTMLVLVLTIDAQRFVRGAPHIMATCFRLMYFL